MKLRSHLFPDRAGWIIHRMSRYKGLYVLATLTFLLDQISKAWIYMGVTFQGEPLTVIPGFFHIVHWGNTGAAWGIFQNMSHWLALLAVVAMAVIYKFRHHLGLRTAAGQVSFGLLCGGILGNLVDRLAHGHVIDFLHFHIGEYAWPAFNVADSAICVGVALYIYFSFFRPEKLEPPNP